MALVPVPQSIARKMVTFSLVSIPCSVCAATERHGVLLHLVHDDLIVQRRVFELDGQDVAQGHIARGFELPSGDTLVLTDADLADLPTPDSREIRVLGFIPEDRVDVTHYDRTYYLGAGRAAAGPAHCCMRRSSSPAMSPSPAPLRTRDTLAVLRVRDDVIVMTTMLWPDEVRPTTGVAPATSELRPEQVALARQSMDASSEGFELEAERDEYTSALREVVEAKAAGLPAPHAPAAKVLPASGVGDLMALLEAAVERAEEEHPKPAARAKKSTMPRCCTRTTGTRSVRKPGRPSRWKSERWVAAELVHLGGGEPVGRAVRVAGQQGDGLLNQLSGEQAQAAFSEPARPSVDQLGAGGRGGLRGVGFDAGSEQGEGGEGCVGVELAGAVRGRIGHRLILAALLTIRQVRSRAGRSQSNAARGVRRSVPVALPGVTL
ncbi:Ku protein [Kitasatospora sp. NPDC002040]|uniref:non-homologous end joining protein Ku n=1 Tax=Kitasatospora sp. NPDC002040 TaxID=3154661 RepID=UPI00332D1301